MSILEKSILPDYNVDILDVGIYNPFPNDLCDKLNQFLNEKFKLELGYLFYHRKLINAYKLKEVFDWFNLSIEDCILNASYKTGRINCARYFVELKEKDTQYPLIVFTFMLLGCDKIIGEKRRGIIL